MRTHHPELGSLLEQLKAMKPEDYRRAINELAQVSKNLAMLQKNDPGRYPLALDAWKTRSRAELIAAELIGAPSAEHETRLRTALDQQISAEAGLRRYERDQLRRRLKNLDELIDRLESKHDQMVESRFQTLMKKGQRARRAGGEGRSASNSSAGSVKGEDE